jgi:hypothetical protein
VQHRAQISHESPHELVQLRFVDGHWCLPLGSVVRARVRMPSGRWSLRLSERGNVR